MGCCNAAALRRQPSLAPFNLFKGGKILFLCKAEQLHMPVISVIFIEPDSRVLETGNGIKMWSEPRPSQLIGG